MTDRTAIWNEAMEADPTAEFAWVAAGNYREMKVREDGARAIRQAIYNEAMEEAARLADQSAACYGAHGSLCADREFVGAKAASLELAAAIRAWKIGEGVSMAYKVFQVKPIGNMPGMIVLKGTDEHEGTHVPVSLADVQANSGSETDLARYFDYRFLRAHGERVARDMQMDEEPRP